jgi:hypothetical protein
MACLLTYFRTNGRDLEEILQEEPKTAEELKTAMDIITDLEKFANKKIKNEIKDFCRRRYLDL